MTGATVQSPERRAAGARANRAALKQTASLLVTETLDQRVVNGPEAKTNY